MTQPLEPGFIHETYRRLRRISQAQLKEGQPLGSIEIEIDLNSRPKQIRGNFVFPLVVEDNPELNAEVIKLIDYAE